MHILQVVPSAHVSCGDESSPCAGHQVRVVTADGHCRPVAVGRCKVEARPTLMVEFVVKDHGIRAQVRTLRAHLDYQGLMGPREVFTGSAAE